ncbi:BatD family protein [Dyadobacter sp. CY312]|uniref:BatD family protein n=1 Tax=Dyadobacter sp. CY312 TaxID=2907303 RepID=UPI001F2BDBD3|nr:BatD family protein [Dyadobacter sp. CY312]MCE7042264.1 BatD family protein [Dyadobacter sp. CY312]
MCFLNISLAQDITSTATIELGSRELGINEPFIISAVLKDVENRPPVIFPDINGLEKRSRSATSTVNTIDGKKIVVQTINQEYYAGKIGQYEIPDFFVLINGVKVRSEGTTVSFGVPESNVINTDEITYLPEPELNGEDVFLSVKTDKRSVYIREGFALGISLYIAESAPVQMEFYQFNIQLQNILKKIRPANCWEENVGIEEIVKRQVNIKGKKYTEYNMYQAQLFPITLQDVVLPSVVLNMLVIENKNAVNVQHKVIRSFRSLPRLIRVKSLPKHPLMDQVAVGQYNMAEKLSSALVYPGESVRYEFKIQGLGNIAAIPAPVIELNSSFDFYPPERSQEIKRSYSKVSGEMTFDYFVVPRKDGTFPLSRYFQWIYFDPVQERYDTLRSAKKIEVKGEDYKLGNISLSGSMGLYDNLEALDSTKESFNYKGFFKAVTNALVIILVLAMFWVFRK